MSNLGIFWPKKHEIKLEFDFCGCTKRWTQDSKCNHLFWIGKWWHFSANRHFNHKTIANGSAVWWEGSHLWGHQNFCLQMAATWWSSLSRRHLTFPQLCFVLAYPREVPSYSLTTSKVAYFKRKYAEEEDLHQGYHGCFPKVRLYFSPNAFPPFPPPNVIESMKPQLLCFYAESNGSVCPLAPDITRRQDLYPQTFPGEAQVSRRPRNLLTKVCVN